MNMRIFSLVLLLFFGLVVPVSGDQQAERQTAAADAGEVEELTVIDKRYRSPTVPRSFGSSRIRDWHAPDNLTLIIELIGRQKLKATFMSPCTGIRFTDTLAFVSRGPFELDRHSSVLLPDGQRCFFRDLVVYVEEDEEWDNVEQLLIIDEE